MFCGKCGNQIPDGAVFCPVCGNATNSQAQTQQTQQPQEEQPTVQYQAQMQYNSQNQTGYAQPADNVYNPTYTPAPNKKITKNTIIGIAAVAVVAVAIIVALVLIIGGAGKGEKSAEDAAKAFVSAMADLDFDDMLDCLPDKVIKAAADEYYDGSIKKLKKDLKEEYEDQKEDGWDIKVKCKVTESEKLDKSELKDLKEEYEDEDIDISISEARTVTVKMTITGEIDDEEIDTTTERTIRVIKVGRRWYVDVQYVSLF